MIDNYLVLQYRSKTIENLIAPEFFLLYTGKNKREEKELELSKIFFSERDSLNLKVKVLTKDNADGILKEYTEFCLILDEERQKSETKEEAIVKTIEKAKERGLLREFLENREIEVMEMMAEDILWEIEFNRYIENQKREGIDEGKAIGEKSGLEKRKLVTLLSLVKKGYLPLDKAIEESGLTKEEFEKKLEPSKHYLFLLLMYHL